MRYIASAVFVIGVFVIVTAVTTQHAAKLDPYMYDYMIENFEDDTHAKNAVAAILLDYRMYDTMFEALILLTAIIGMKQFLPGAADLRARDELESVDQTEATGEQSSERPSE